MIINKLRHNFHDLLSALSSPPQWPLYHLRQSFSETCPGLRKSTGSGPENGLMAMMIPHHLPSIIYQSKNFYSRISEESEGTIHYLKLTYKNTKVRGGEGTQLVREEATKSGLGATYLLKIGNIEAVYMAQPRGELGQIALSRFPRFTENYEEFNSNTYHSREDLPNLNLQDVPNKTKLKAQLARACQSLHDNMGPLALTKGLGPPNSRDKG